MTAPHHVPFCLGLLLLTATTALAQLPAQTPPPDRASSSRGNLDLAACLNLALNRNTDILKAQQEIKRLHGVIVEVRAEALPQVTLNTSLATEAEELANGAFAGFGPRRQQSFWTAGLAINQLLYNGGAVGAAIDIARLSENNAFLQLDATIDATVFLVREAYYNVLLTRSLIAVREANVKLLEEELANQQRRLNAGTVTRFNVLRAEVELANAQPPLIRARNLQRIALLNLARLLAIDYPHDAAAPPFHIIGQLEYLPSTFDLDQLLTLAHQRRPEIRLADQQIAINRRQLVIDRSGSLPRVSAFGGYDFISDRNKNNFDAANQGWSVGVQGQWNLFDGFRTQGQLEQTRANITSAQLDSEQTRRDIDAEVRQAYFDWVEARELIQSQRKNVEQATEALRLANSRFDVGAATQLDVLQANVALTDARTNELEARFDYNLAIARLERVTSAPVLNRESARIPTRTQAQPPAPTPPTPDAPPSPRPAAVLKRR
ncbi:MAG: TolC family protein [Verrucomicrobiia bacterium]